MKKICFVCDANECRSPMAEAIFKHLLKQKNIMGFEVKSCGLGVNLNGKLNPKAKNALEKIGIKTKTKKSKQLKLIYPNVLYLTMTKEQKNYLNKKNVFTLGEMVGGSDVEDPYQKGQEEYDKLATLLTKHLTKLTDKLIKLN